jgi:hypothetical protein
MPSRPAPPQQPMPQPVYQPQPPYPNNYQEWQQRQPQQWVKVREPRTPGNVGADNLTILLLLTFPPIGLVYMWFKASWQPVTKAIITTIWVVAVFYLFAYALSQVSTTTPYGY